MPWDKMRKTSRHTTSANFSRQSQARPWGGVAGGELEERVKGWDVVGWKSKETWTENARKDYWTDCKQKEKHSPKQQQQKQSNNTSSGKELHHPQQILTYKTLNFTKTYFLQYLKPLSRIPVLKLIYHSFSFGRFQKLPPFFGGGGNFVSLVSD